MRKIQITELAALGEIIASIGVIVSLGFLAYTIERNNEYSQATTDNLMYEMMNGVYEIVVTNPDVASIHVKLANGETLTAIEQMRHANHLWQHLNIWEMAFDRHQQGMLSNDKWEAWNQSFTIELLAPPFGLPRELWATDETYGTEFRDHVNEMWNSLP